ncbi:uncharacterized protein BJ171DRAFT_603015 [Polychytrium aggregatum]|uniref:uncharacterized protein n=1 Tax=Polychytrium aggregatum TaxID=110093 RepID=UPI0022FF450B|nr:uncharacterized protein BJ171DRAFT_603015 [Polychytrium aggregatum]KAI9193722.1 hypothetical protein BJ171DRAFT_603015 [Polychytrium aggregatum]
MLPLPPGIRLGRRLIRFSPCSSRSVLAPTSMLTAEPSLLSQSPWIRSFHVHGRSIPNPSPPSQDPRSSSSLPGVPRPQKQSLPLELICSRINSIPIPSAIQDKYLSSRSPVACQLRISLFDLSQNVFFGKTWICPLDMDLRVSFQHYHKYHDPSQDGPLSAIHRDAAGPGLPHYRPSHLSPETPLQDMVALEAPALHQLRRTPNVLVVVHDFGHRHDHDRSLHLSLDRPALVAPWTVSASSRTESSSNESESPSVPSYKCAVIGRRVSVRLRNQSSFFHTHVLSKNVVLVAEFVFLVQQTASLPDQDSEGSASQDGNNMGDGSTATMISAGWTFLHLFDPAKNGLNVALLTSEKGAADGTIVDGPMITAPIYSGTPRSLYIISSALMNLKVVQAPLPVLAGSTFSYKLVYRPDLYSICGLWNEHIMIDCTDPVAGIEFFTPRDPVAAQTSIGYLSNISLTSSIPVAQFEEAFLAALALSHAKTFQDHTGPGPVQGQSQNQSQSQSQTPPEILERRLRLGFHNGHRFMNDPIIVNLNPDDSAAALVFHGSLEIASFDPNEKIALVAIAEYKVAFVEKDQTRRKTGVGALLEKLSGHGKPSDRPDVSKTVEKLVCVGWTAWVPAEQPALSPNLPLITATNLNPVFALVYNPASLSGPALASTDKLDRTPTLSLSFDFSHQNPSLSPVLDPVAPRPSVASVKPRPLLIDEATSPLTLSEQDETSSQELEVLQPRPSSRASQRPSKAAREDYEPDLKPVETTKQWQQAPYLFRSPKSYPSRPQISRSDKARLLNAGFPVILDDQGLKPIQIGLSPGDISNLRLDMDVEFRDPIRRNELCLGFMGVKLNQNAQDRITGKFPSTVVFSYQFYNFPHATTTRVGVYTGPLPARPPTASEHPFRPTSTGGQRPQRPHPGHHRSSSLPNHSRRWSQQSHLSQQSLQSHQPVPATAERECECIWPGILYELDQQGEIDYDRAPGILHSYQVDLEADAPSTLSSNRFGPTAYLHYLGFRTMVIDCWDGDSMIYLGSSTVQMFPALRQGRLAVTFDVEADIVHEKYPDDPIASPEPGEVSKVVGALYLRITHLGHASAAGAQPDRSLSPTLATQAGRDAVVLHDYHHGLQKHGEVTHYPHRLPEVDPELYQILSKAYEERLKSNSDTSPRHSGSADSTSTDKKARIARVRKSLRNTGLEISEACYGEHQLDMRDMFTYQMSRKDRQRDLQTIDMVRSRKRRTALDSHLRRQILSRHTVRATFGQAHFFEFLLQNPYSHESTFRIVWDDQELRLVTDAAEWRYLRRIHSIRSGIDERIVSFASDGVPEVYMLPNETIPVAFVFQSFLSGSVTSMSPRSDELQDSVFGMDLHDGIQARVINVSFLNPSNTPIALLDLAIQPQNYFVDRSLRLFRSENENLYKEIRFSFGSMAHANILSATEGVSTVYNSASPSQKYVVCHDTDVICGLNEVAHGKGNVSQLHFRLRVGPAPEVRSIYLLFYDDPFNVSLFEIWRVVIHSLHRLDLNCTMGQTNIASLVLRGSNYSRTVECCTDRSDELMVITPSPFTLTAGSLNEISLAVRPQSGTASEILLSIIDYENRSLVSSWIVVTHCKAPHITKSFEISIPRGRAVNKRVSFKNPYPQPKVFFLKTDNDKLLQFKDTVIELESGQSQYIGLRFAPTSLIAAEILIFLNDEHDQIEECLRVNVKYIDKI